MFTVKNSYVKLAFAALVVAGLSFLATPFGSHASVNGGTPSTLPAPRRPASVGGCVSYWYLSYSGTSSWNLFHFDPDGLPLTDLQFSRSYNDPTDLSRGYLDFDRDGTSDIFSTVPIGNGLYQWRYLSAGRFGWFNLASDATPPDQLRFGDFNGDGYTDVFALKDIGGGQLGWNVSYSGTTGFQQINSAPTPLGEMRFGDFNGDGKTDVFALQDIGGGYLGWNVSYSGTTIYQQINSAPTPLSEMQFGDVDGDGQTDVFTTIWDPVYSENRWLYSSAGTGAYQTIVLTNLSVHDVQMVGDFNSDHHSDWFYTTPLGNHVYQWAYQWFVPNFGVGSTSMAQATTPPDQLRFADFNGDGTTDVFKLERRCPLYLPLLAR